MKKRRIYSLIAGMIALLSGCTVQVQTYNLSDDIATSLHYEGSTSEDKLEDEGEQSNLVGVPVLGFYGGDLKRGGIWWAGKGISLEKGDEFIYDIENVGPDSIPFGATFPPIDLIKEAVMLKISARAEAADSIGSPTLYVQFEDAEGYKTNVKWPSNTIENSAEYKDYYFDLTAIYTQVTPKKHKVNGALVNSIKFFINPGQKAYTGLIYIKEIKIIPVVKP